MRHREQNLMSFSHMGLGSCSRGQDRGLCLSLLEARGEADCGGPCVCDPGGMAVPTSIMCKGVCGGER